jgi:hypothetical protein
VLLQFSFGLVKLLYKFPKHCVVAGQNWCAADWTKELTAVGSLHCVYTAVADGVLAIDYHWPLLLRRVEGSQANGTVLFF